jgi:hypothetical protein
MRDAELSACCTAACSMSLRLTVQLLARSRGRVRVVDVEVGVDAFAGLLARLARAFAARESFPSDGGTKQLYCVVLLLELSLEFARLS